MSNVDRLNNSINIGEFISGIDFSVAEELASKNIEINPIDYNWRFTFRSVTNRIRSIISSPRLHLKTERNILLADIASKVDSVGMNMTFKDPRLWKLKGKDRVMSPEYVYATLFEDEIAIYENKFITLLIDIMFRHITLEISFLFSKVGKFDKLVAGRKIGLGDLSAVIENSNFLFSEDALNSKEVDEEENLKTHAHYLTTNTSEIIEILQDLLDLRTRLVHLFETNFYKSCKKAGKMSVKDIYPTNILTQDADYNFCYLFFKELQRIRRKETDEQEIELYVNLVLKKIIASLKKIGFDTEDQTNTIKVNEEDGRYIFENVKFRRGFINTTINCNTEDEIIVDVNIDYPLDNFVKKADIVERRSAKYLLKLYPESKYKFDSAEKMNEEFISAVSSVIDSDGPYCNCYIVTDMVDIRMNNAVLCSLTDYKLDGTVENMLRSFFVLTEGDSFIYSKRCPICGAMGIEYSKGNYNCMLCNSLYSILLIQVENKRRDVLWLKRAVRPYETDEEE